MCHFVDIKLCETIKYYENKTKMLSCGCHRSSQWAFHSKSATRIILEIAVWDRWRGMRSVFKHMRYLSVFDNITGILHQIGVLLFWQWLFFPAHSYALLCFHTCFNLNTFGWYPLGYVLASRQIQQAYVIFDWKGSVGMQFMRMHVW